MKKNKYLVKPNVKNPTLTKKIQGHDEKKNKVRTNVIQEKTLTIYLNSQEIVTLMTIGDHPKYLSIGYLLNQNMLKKNDKITKVEVNHTQSGDVISANEQGEKLVVSINKKHELYRDLIEKLREA